jgi:hypothetical protein
MEINWNIIKTSRFSLDLLCFITWKTKKRKEQCGLTPAVYGSYMCSILPSQSIAHSFYSFFSVSVPWASRLRIQTPLWVKPNKSLSSFLVFYTGHGTISLLPFVLQYWDLRISFRQFKNSLGCYNASTTNSRKNCVLEPIQIAHGFHFGFLWFEIKFRKKSVLKLNFLNC